LPLWEWDGKVWQERAQSGQQPWLNMSGNAMTYDSFRQECVVFGQEGGVVDGQETQFFYPAPDFNRYVWRWNGQQWQADPPTPTIGVAAETYHTMCFDSARNALVLFGGYNVNQTYASNYTYEMVYQDTPAVLKQPTVQFALLGQSTSILVVAAGAPLINYQWQKDGANLTDDNHFLGATTDTLQVTSVGANDLGVYSVVLSNLCGTATSQPIQLKVSLRPISFTRGPAAGALPVFSWSNSAAVLQQATTPAGPWTDIPSATSPYSPGIDGQQRYFRMRN
jgi:hypothetical protein